MKMKYILLLLSLFVFFSCSDNKYEKLNDMNAFWSIEKEEALLLDRQDAAKWDMNMFENDIQYLMSDTDLPFESAVFPTPYYDLVGKESFKGVGNFGFAGGNGFEKKIGDKTILYNSFFVGTSDINKQFIGNKKNEVFFQIIVLTDFVDTLNYTHLLSEIVSRNHPHYLGQGFYKTKNSKIDYLAFITANQDAYAIVNMRYFDLKFGRTILIAPQKDHSFRSMQIKSPKLSSNEIEDYTDKLLKEQDIIDFFASSGTI